jgi:hypothetical protein
MRIIEDRAVLTVLRRGDSWAVELEGEPFGVSPDKEISKAAANKKARELQDAGTPCQVRVAGERTF